MNRYDWYNSSEEYEHVGSICRSCKRYNIIEKRGWEPCDFLCYPDEECGGFYDEKRDRIVGAKRFIPDGCDSGCGVIIKECDFYKFDKNSYDIYLKSERWKRRRRNIIEMSDFKCSKCGSAKNLEVHHINYSRAPFEDDEDLVCLCHICHSKLHKGDEKNEPEGNDP